MSRKTILVAVAAATTGCYLTQQRQDAAAHLELTAATVAVVTAAEKAGSVAAAAEQARGSVAPTPVVECSPPQQKQHQHQQTSLLLPLLILSFLWLLSGSNLRADDGSLGRRALLYGTTYLLATSIHLRSEGELS